MFENELDLQKTFIKNLEKNKNEFIHEEFNARFGNVDIVKVIYNGSHDLTSEQAKILSDVCNARVIAYLHKTAIRTLDYLTNKTGYTKTQVLTSIGLLKKNKMICEIKSERYIINEDFHFPKIKFIAFEAKLKDWKKAISQSLRNTNFSYKSYVVMPLKTAEFLSKKHKNYFKIYNIGLIGVDKNFNKTFIKPIKKETKKVNPLFINALGKMVYQKEQVC